MQKGTRLFVSSVGKAPFVTINHSVLPEFSLYDNLVLPIYSLIDQDNLLHHHKVRADVHDWCQETIASQWTFGMRRKSSGIAVEEGEITYSITYQPAIKFTTEEAMVIFKLRWL